MKDRLNSNINHFDIASDACLNLIDLFLQISDDQIDNQSLSQNESEVIIKLEKRLAEIKKRKFVIENPLNTNSIYEYITLYFQEYPDKRLPLFHDKTISPDVLSKIEKKLLKVRDIKPSIMAKICQHISLNINDAIELIKRTIQLNFIGNSTVNSMARHSYNSGLKEKDASMAKGLNELLLKASKNKPIGKEAGNNEMERNLYIEELKSYYQ